MIRLVLVLFAFVWGVILYLELKSITDEIKDFEQYLKEVMSDE